MHSAPFDSRYERSRVLRAEALDIGGVGAGRSATLSEIDIESFAARCRATRRSYRDDIIGITLIVTHKKGGRLGDCTIDGGVISLGAFLDATLRRVTDSGVAADDADGMADREEAQENPNGGMRARVLAQEPGGAWSVARRRSRARSSAPQEERTASGGAKGRSLKSLAATSERAARRFVPLVVDEEHLARALPLLHESLRLLSHAAPAASLAPSQPLVTRPEHLQVIVPPQKRQVAASDPRAARERVTTLTHLLGEQVSASTVLFLHFMRVLLTV